MKIVISIALALMFSACSQENKSSSSSTETAVKPAAEKTEAPQVKTEETVIQTTVVEETKAVVAQRSGQTIFTACAACHGADASKSALGKSQIIKGWKSEKIEAALNGYKDGSYGGAMKGIMKGQVSALSADDIKAVAEYISKL